MSIKDIPGYREAPRTRTYMIPNATKLPHLKQGRGRPFRVAVIPIANNARIRLLDEFKRVMRTVTYREVTALAVAFGRHRNTVNKWRYGLQFPDAYTMLDTIEWHTKGRKTIPGHHRETGISVDRAKPRRV